ncbi:HlyD family secretion protein [Brevibacillus sp. 7WMA2]|uniref:Putative multidrug resistance protein EmrK n=1 Tax=Brevibacillus laterosporus LMG 15441 TaxID=1042163 RepID=A0A075R8U2_BRELA|nr:MULTISPECIES: HlyD family efflux transporter periplasmic adaptor subunit [Brevibacillus]HAS00656.1 HlyD family secretion protein [Brevibacillus sp.]AIG28264.1 putative multidrug resistance protein EmrK [Brevibacillus laterosporus LMG 15441]AUM66635.1 HlyD family secretion protein [Brevibacillus laterosporus]AYK05503.1 HlyD family secretion protein [Brevibacillus laterosporus]ERM17174.1 hemolysin D [Brevibacillus laterosporus PE36]
MKKKFILSTILLLMVVAGGGIGYYYWYQGTHYITTEDARVAGDTYRVMPRISGKLTSLDLSDGQSVIAEQIVGQQDTTNIAGNMLDNATLRAPITGTVLKVTAKSGEVVAPGQSVATIVDMNKLYVSANIEETDLGRIHVGQSVEFTLDSFKGQTFRGQVSELGTATASTFSLLPATSTSGNFTKVTQRIPIKISINDKQNSRILPGMSAVIKIHLKGN